MTNYCRVQHFVNYYKKNIKSIFYTQKQSYFLTNYVNLPINYDFIKTTKAYVDMLYTENYPVIWIGLNIPFDNKIQEILLS